MKYFPIILYALLTLCNAGLGAQTNTFDLAGTLKTEGNNLVPIKISLQIDGDGTVSGSSVTNFYSEDRTESKIAGRLDLKDEVLSFAEVQNISTNSDASADEFCYIKVDRLAWKESKTKTIFNGSFTGYYPDSSTCAQGEIYLVSMDLLKEFVNENEKLSGLKDSLKNSIQDQSKQQNAPRVTGADFNAPLENEAEAYVKWNSDAIRIYIWDSEKEDDDRINIYLNDSLHYKSVVATNDKKLYRFHFSGDTCTIKIVAENEGEWPPNTFRAQLIDSAKVYSTQTKLKKGEFVKFKFIRPMP